MVRSGVRRPHPRAAEVTIAPWFFESESVNDRTSTVPGCENSVRRPSPPRNTAARVAPGPPGWQLAVTPPTRDEIGDSSVLNIRISDLTPHLNRVNAVVAVRYEMRVLSDHFNRLNATAVGCVYLRPILPYFTSSSLPKRFFSQPGIKDSRTKNTAAMPRYQRVLPKSPVRTAPAAKL